MPKKSRKGCVSFMVKIAVMGDSESIKGFAALGLDIFICEDNDTAEETFKNISSEGYGLIYITEHLCEALSRRIEKADKNFNLNIVPIPGVSRNNGIGVNRLKAAVEKAVGSDIIFNKEN